MVLGCDCGVAVIVVVVVVDGAVVWYVVVVGDVVVLMVLLVHCAPLSRFTCVVICVLALFGGGCVIGFVGVIGMVVVAMCGIYCCVADVVADVGGDRYVDVRTVECGSVISTCVVIVGVDVGCVVVVVLCCDLCWLY